MDETFTAKAIVLSRQPYRENDSRTVVYSLEYGRLELVARGTNAIKSKLAGHIEPFCLSDFMIVRGRHCRYIGAAACRDSFARLKADLTKLETAGIACGIVLQTTREGEADEELFCLLENFLQFLNQHDLMPQAGDLFLHIFILKLLAALGYQPELYACSACGKNLDSASASFDPTRGGLLCTQCVRNKRLTISAECVSFLKLIISESFFNLSKIKLSEQAQNEIIFNIKSFFQYTI